MGNKPFGTSFGAGRRWRLFPFRRRRPAKARGLYEKKTEKMLHGKLDESRNKANAALAIYPKFPEALTCIRE